MADEAAWGVAAPIGSPDIAGVPDIEASLDAVAAGAGAGASGVEGDGVLESTESARTDPAASIDLGSSTARSSPGDQADLSGSTATADASTGRSGFDERGPSLGGGVSRASQGIRCSPLIGFAASGAPEPPAEDGGASSGRLVRASGLHWAGSSAGVGLDGTSAFDEVACGSIELACVVPVVCSGSGSMTLAVEPSASSTLCHTRLSNRFATRRRFRSHVLDSRARPNRRHRRRSVDHAG